MTFPKFQPLQFTEMVSLVPVGVTPVGRVKVPLTVIYSSPEMVPLVTLFPSPSVTAIVSVGIARLITTRTLTVTVEYVSESAGVKVA